MVVIYFGAANTHSRLLSCEAPVGVLQWGKMNRDDSREPLKIDTIPTIKFEKNKS